MATLVSTGQITIIDSNDAKPITAFITASISPQQIYNPDSLPVYVPDYTSTPLVLTAKVYIGSTSDSAASLSSKSWATSIGGTSLGSGSTLTISANQTPGAGASIYYFEANYVDALTGAATHIVAQIVVSILKTGTNASFIQVTGTDVIEESTTATKNNAFLIATLWRGSTTDVIVSRYKWFKMIAGAYQQIYVGNTALNVVDGITYTAATLYGFKLESEYVSTPSVAATVGSNVQPSAADDNILRRGITINERAVTDYGLFKVQIIDGTDTFETTFTVYDISDPYLTQLISTAGDKLTNGTGSTNIIPRVFYGAGRVSDVSGWSFIWSFRDKDGNQAAFINENQTGVAAGLPIASNTATTVTLALAAANANFVANCVVKLVKGSDVKYYEVASVNASVPLAPVITLKSVAVIGIYNYIAPTVNEFQAGNIFICDYTMTTTGSVLETAAQISVTEWEIDSKGTIFCESSRP